MPDQRDIRVLPPVEIIRGYGSVEGAGTLVLKRRDGKDVICLKTLQNVIDVSSFYDYRCILRIQQKQPIGETVVDFSVKKKLIEREGDIVTFPIDVQKEWRKVLLKETPLQKQLVDETRFYVITTKSGIISASKDRIRPDAICLQQWSLQKDVVAGFPVYNDAMDVVGLVKEKVLGNIWSVHWCKDRNYGKEVRGLPAVRLQTDDLAINECGGLVLIKHNGKEVLCLKTFQSAINMQSSEKYYAVLKWQGKGRNSAKEIKLKVKKRLIETDGDMACYVIKTRKSFFNSLEKKLMKVAPYQAEFRKASSFKVIANHNEVYKAWIDIDCNALLIHGKQEHEELKGCPVYNENMEVVGLIKGNRKESEWSIAWFNAIQGSNESSPVAEKYDTFVGNHYEDDIYDTPEEDLSLKVNKASKKVLTLSKGCEGERLESVAKEESTNKRKKITFHDCIKKNENLYEPTIIKRNENIEDYDPYEPVYQIGKLSEYVTSELFEMLPKSGEKEKMNATGRKGAIPNRKPPVPKRKPLSNGSGSLSPKQIVALVQQALVLTSEVITDGLAVTMEEMLRGYNIQPIKDAALPAVTEERSQERNSDDSNDAVSAAENEIDFGCSIDRRDSIVEDIKPARNGRKRRKMKKKRRKGGMAMRGKRDDTTKLSTLDRMQSPASVNPYVEGKNENHSSMQKSTLWKHFDTEGKKENHSSMQKSTLWKHFDTEIRIGDIKFDVREELAVDLDAKHWLAFARQLSVPEKVIKDIQVLHTTGSIPALYFLEDLKTRYPRETLINFRDKIKTIKREDAVEFIDTNMESHIMKRLAEVPVLQMEELMKILERKASKITKTWRNLADLYDYKNEEITYIEVPAVVSRNQHRPTMDLLSHLETSQPSLTVAQIGRVLEEVLLHKTSKKLYDLCMKK